MTFETPETGGDKPLLAKFQLPSAALGIYVQGTYEGVDPVEGPSRIRWYEQDLVQKIDEVVRRETAGGRSSQLRAAGDFLNLPDRVGPNSGVCTVLAPSSVAQDEATRIGQIINREVSIIVAKAPRNPTFFIPIQPDMFPETT